MKIVIAGGGFCGSMVAKRLDAKTDLELTLIDRKEYFEYYPSLPKLIVDPDYHKKIIKRYSQFLDNTKIINEKIEKITPDHVHTEKRRIDFDILVIALGAKYPIFLENDKDVFTIRSGEEVKELSKRVKEADRVLIVGGGLIGTETAAELASKTHKEVVLVQSKDRLIERNPIIASLLAENYLKNKGVSIRYGEKIVAREGKKYITKRGREIESDVCIWSTGVGYDSEVFQNFDDPSFNDREQLKVNEYLQVEGYPNIFAGGDIIDIDEEKTGHNADTHARIISKNILRYIEDRPLMTYNKFEIPLLISLGDINGILTLPLIAIPGPVPAFVKYMTEKAALLRL